MSKQRKSNFRDKVNKNTESQKNRKSSYGYLQLPKGVQVYKESEGAVQFDILPYEVTDEHHLDRDDENNIAVVGELWYKKPFRIHRNVGVDNEIIVCPSSVGKKCPICEYRSKLIREKADKDEIKLLNYSLRNLYAIIPIGSKEYDEAIHIWEISQGNFQSQLNDELVDNPEFGNFPDIEEGLTLKVRFSEETLFKNKYFEARRIDFKERKEAYDELVLKDVPNLDEVLKILSYKEIEAKFLSIDPDEVPDKDDELEKETINKKPLRKRDDDEELELERKKKTIQKEDDEEPEPERKHSIKRKSADDDEENEQKKSSIKRKSTKVDDEDEDDKPTKKGDKNKCPHGHRFGADNNKFDDCDNCKIWDNCDDATDE